MYYAQNNPKEAPNWGCYPPWYPPVGKRNDSCEDEEPRKSLAVYPMLSTNRSEECNPTPPPSWNYPPPPVKGDHHPPPYWNYYGYPPPPMYPPVYSPYFFYPPPPSDSEEASGYSSTDEMARYTKKSICPQPPENLADSGSEDEATIEESSESDTEDNNTKSTAAKQSSLQAIRSVSDINIYNKQDSDEHSSSDEESTTESSSHKCVVEDTIPHQLSVIFEESERTDSRHFRSVSRASTIVDDGEVEEEECVAITVKLPVRCQVNEIKVTVDQSQPEPVKEVDWWSEIRSGEDDYVPRRKVMPEPDPEPEQVIEKKEVDFWAEINNSNDEEEEEDDSSELEDEVFIEEVDSVSYSKQDSPTCSHASTGITCQVKSIVDQFSSILEKMNNRTSAPNSRRSSLTSEDEVVVRRRKTNIASQRHSIAEGSSKVVVDIPGKTFRRNSIACLGLDESKEFRERRSCSVLGGIASTKDETASINVKHTTSSEIVEKMNSEFGSCENTEIRCDKKSIDNSIIEVENLKVTPRESTVGHLVNYSSVSIGSEIETVASCGGNDDREMVNSCVVKRQNLESTAEKRWRRNSMIEFSGNQVSKKTRPVSMIGDMSGDSDREINSGSCDTKEPEDEEMCAPSVANLRRSFEAMISKENITRKTRSSSETGEFAAVSISGYNRENQDDFTSSSTLRRRNSEATNLCNGIGGRSRPASVIGGITNHFESEQEVTSFVVHREVGKTNAIQPSPARNSKKEPPSGTRPASVIGGITRNNLQLQEESQGFAAGRKEDVTSRPRPASVIGDMISDNATCVVRRKNLLTSQEKVLRRRSMIDINNDDGENDEVKRIRPVSVIGDIRVDGNGRFVFDDIDNKDEVVEEVKLVSIKDRIQSLQSSVFAKTKDECDHKPRRKVSTTDSHLSIQKANSRKNSVKSFEGSEDDLDSGVTSDISRHVSETDTEDYVELRKMNKYQRAATHSRLFKLIQDEFDEDDQEIVVARASSPPRRDYLNLPLKKNEDADSFPSSGFASPASPTVNDRLVHELVQSLLRNKKANLLGKLSMEKLHAAALRILQEDMDGLETLSSSEDGSFLSPMKPGTGSSTAAQTPQEFLDYNQYYDSWAEYDILPSKAFKRLQELSSSNRNATLLAKCPRILNRQKQEDNALPSPDPPIEPQQAGSVS